MPALARSVASGPEAAGPADHGHVAPDVAMADAVDGPGQAQGTSVGTGDELEEKAASGDEKARGGDEKALGGDLAPDGDLAPGAAGDADAPGNADAPGEAVATDYTVTAWLQVAAAFLLYFNSWGLVNGFGTFQAYYKDQHLSSTSNIAWIGSVQSCLTLILSVLSGPLFDMGFLRALLWLGSFLIVFGFMMASLSHELYQFMLSHGFCVGIGSGLVYVPTVAICVDYFSRYRGLALGVAAIGSSLGSIIYPIMFNRLRPRIGFPWTMRVIGFMALGLLLIALALVRPRGRKRRIQPLFLPRAFREPPYALFAAAEFFGLMGVYIPYFYITSYASGPGHMNKDLAGYMVPILKACSIVGRLVPNVLSDFMGPMNMFLPTTFATSMLNFGWTGVHTPAGVIVYDVLYGVASGTVVSITPAVVASITARHEEVGTRLGMCFMIGGLGMLVGSPVAGVILDKDSPSYVGAQLFAAALMLASTLCLVASRFARSGKLVARA